MLPPPPLSTLFPYTTLFRSGQLQPLLGKVSQYARLLRCVSRVSQLLTARSMPTTIFRITWHCILPVRSTRPAGRSEEHTSELQSQSNLVCRLLLEKKKNEQI